VVQARRRRFTMRCATTGRPGLRDLGSGSACRSLDRSWQPPRGLDLGRGPRQSRPLRRGPARRGLQPARQPAAVGPQYRSHDLARLEAALFLAREPLSPRRLAKLAGLADGTRARALIRELNRLLDEGGASFRVEQIAGGFQLLTRAAFGPWIRRLLGAPAENRLSAAALETLAIVAYRQPVTRSEIESIRGVGCEDMLRQLMERDFVAIGGRAEEIGRPNVYVTSRRFLQAFGLGRIEDLPAIGPPTDPETPAAPESDPSEPQGE
jgi:segregation and condensation protein B